MGFFATFVCALIVVATIREGWCLPLQNLETAEAGLPGLSVDKAAPEGRWGRSILPADVHGPERSKSRGRFVKAAVNEPVWGRHARKAADEPVWGRHAKKAGDEPVWGRHAKKAGDEPVWGRHAKN